MQSFPYNDQKNFAVDSGISSPTHAFVGVPQTKKTAISLLQEFCVKRRNGIPKYIETINENLVSGYRFGCTVSFIDGAGRYLFLTYELQ